jgi:hypothetical protein
VSPLGGAPGDEGAGEVEHGEVGVGAFLPASEDAAEAVEPGVGALDDPATSTEAGLALRGRLGPCDRDALERRAGELKVVQVRARRRDPERDALALGEEAPLRPFLALSVGFGPVSSPPSGALASAPSIASHSHSIPCLAS